MIRVQQLAMTATMARFLRGSVVELAWPDGRVVVGDLSFRRDELTRTTLVCARPGHDALDLVTACAVAEVSLVLT